MPPKAKITKQDIVEAGLSLVRREGIEALNVRALACALSCSTQPVFSNFESMGQLEREIISAAFACYLDFIEREVKSEKYPRYKAFGMAYVRFAREERELFRLLFMRDRSGEDLSPSPDFKESVDMIAAAHGLSREVAGCIHLEMWALVHGIGIFVHFPKKIHLNLTFYCRLIILHIRLFQELCKVAHSFQNDQVREQL